MTKIYVFSANRATDGAISKLINKMKKADLYTDNYTKANYVLAVGDRVETYDFILQCYKENKKIIHLFAGEVGNWTTHDGVYRHSMTLMSMMQLCTNDEAKERVVELCESVNKKSNAYTIGNVMLDNMETDETLIPELPYDLVLYNPPTQLPKEGIKKEIHSIQAILSKHYIWITPNGDKNSDLVEPFTNTDSVPRPQFLGLLKNCNRFITNSSCQYYEAPFIISKDKIISIGVRNKDRSSKYSNMSIRNASDNIIKIFKELK